MTEQTAAPKAATYKEILAACPGIDPKNADDAVFIADCQKNDLTASECNENYCSVLMDRIKSKDETIAAQAAEIAELKAAAASAPKAKGAPSVGTSVKSEGSDTGDATAQFKAEVAKKKASGMPHDRAVIAVNREFPNLVAAMRASNN